MKLVDLEPRFLHVRPSHFPHVERIEDAQGLMFLCPACFARNDGPVGTHEVLVWFADRGVDPAHVASPRRWKVTGTGFHDLTLSPSIDLSNARGSGCQWHGWVRDGEAR